MTHKLIPAAFIAAMIATPAMAASVCSDRNEVSEYLEAVAHEIDASSRRLHTDVDSESLTSNDPKLQHAISSMQREALNLTGLAKLVRAAIHECQTER